jgi:hypothetical protein
MSSASVTARRELDRILEERRHALRAGLGGNLMDDLAAELDAARTAYVGLAVTEIASFRAQLSGPQVG